MRKYILTVMALVLAVVVHAQTKNTAATHQSKQPNVIIILTDDQGDGDMECHGSPYLKTPAINQLYQESVRFTNFHVDPMCSPTRAALLTGCYAARAGVWHTIGGRSLLKEGMPTLADLFKANGYQTAVFGKWHLGENYPFRPMDRGFNESLVFGGGGIGSNADYWQNDYFDGTYKHNGKYQPYKGYCNTVWFDQALQYIKSNKDKPFFVYLPTNIPHAPLKVDPRYVEPYRNKVSERLASYYGMISKLDEDLGNFMHALKETGADSNTIILFMSDNGPCPWFGGIVIDWNTGFVKEGYSNGMRGGKIWGYENAHRVPFFIRWPEGGIGGGKDVKALSAHIDVLPTLVDLCKLKKTDRLQVDGRSLAPLLRNRQQDWPDDRTFITDNQRVEYPVKDKEYQVMTRKWRLVKREKDELYDIISDPGQQKDLAAENPGVVKDLYSRYNRWWKSVSTDFNQYAAIRIGAVQENPATLHPHDAHIREGKNIWVVKVEKPGRYTIRMNRWPDESGKRMVENQKGDKELPVSMASMELGNIHLSKPVTADMRSFSFEADLREGITCITTYFTLKGQTKTTGSAWLSVQYQGKAAAVNLARYIPSVPDRLLKDHFHELIEPYN
jgi:arylsulfatase A-like enzyme